MERSSNDEQNELGELEEFAWMDDALSALPDELLASALPSNGYPDQVFSNFMEAWDHSYFAKEPAVGAAQPPPEQKPIIIAVESDFVHGRKIRANPIFVPPTADVSEETSRDLRMPEAHLNLIGKHLPPKLAVTALPGGQVTPPEYRDGFSEPLHSSLRTKLSSLLKEIHESICDKHFVNTEEPKPKRFKHSVVSPDKAVPTAKDVGNAHGIDVVKIPSMSLSDILDMLRELFGPDQELIETFRKEQIDGAGLVLLSLEGLQKFLKMPLGSAITLDGIVRLARQSHNLPVPV